MGWLLAGEPRVVYGTLTDLLDRGEEDNVVVRANMAGPQHTLMKKIFEELNRDGYWGTPKDMHTR